MSHAILKLGNLTKRFGKNIVLDNVNLEIMSGEIFGIIGVSGSGKTTMLNTMIGFLEPSSGDVLFRHEHLLDFEGDSSRFRSVYSNEMDVKKTFGFAAQTPSFYGKLRAMENLRHFGKLYNLSRDVRKSNAEILIKLMGLYEARDVLAKNLSGGMQKRLDIACALIHDPKVLILDEPTADLDPILRKQMWNLIREINRKGTTIVLSSHFLDELEHLCDRVGILNKGKIIITGTPEEVKSYYSKDEEIRLETSPGRYEGIIRNLENIKSRLGIARIEVSDNKLVVYTRRAEKSLHEILHIIEKKGEILIDVTVEKPSFHEVLEKLVRIELDKVSAGDEKKAAAPGGKEVPAKAAQEPAQRKKRGRRAKR